MGKEIVVSERENIAAIFENGKIADFFMNEGEQLVGDIILGKVDSIVPSIDAAFVSIGKNKNGFIHITDLSLRNAKKKIGIKNFLEPKQNILVQVAKEATGSKGPRLTEMITLPGKYIVLTPYERKVGISKKIEDSFERDRLVYIAKSICQSGYGIIVRTEAEGQSEEAIKEDLDYLLKRWNEILKMSETSQVPAVLYRDQDLLYKVLRDAITSDVEKITVDTPETKVRAVELLQSWSSESFRLVSHNKSHIPLAIQYNLFTELEKALNKKVPLPSGGYLIIEKTEALTVIDVNSGNSRTYSLTETILQTNKEAAGE
ncbi:MAG: ribonuclease E/G, partial [Candidatus Sericytochromatia bacterium]